MNARIFLVEDDPGLGFVMQDNLTRQGYEVTLTKDGEKAEDIFNKDKFDLCILDVMLPKKDGFTLAQSIRKKDSSIPILFVTAKVMLEDKVKGFQSGGDDYIVKPFSMEELCLRINVFLRRSNSGIPKENPAFSLGQYNFDFNNLTLDHSTGVRTLTQKEAEILRLLCFHQDKVLKRDEILKAVWGDDDYFMGRSMDVFISKLRKYLKQDPSVGIVNFHGVGFKLEIQKS